MRTLRHTALVALSAALLASPLGAEARDVPGVPDTSVPSYEGLPYGWSFEFIPLAGPEWGPQGDYAHVDNDAAPGWGTGSLRLHLGPVSADKLTFTQSLDGLSEASVWVRSAQVPIAPEKIEFSVEVAGEQWYGRLPTGETWTEVDLAHLGLAPPLSTTPETTLLEVAAAHPQDAVLGFATMNAYDAAGTATYLDGWSWTAGGTSRQIDFEGPHEASSCLMTTSGTVVTAGEDVAVTGSVSAVLTGSPWAGRELNLISRYYGVADPLVWAPGEVTDATGSYTFRLRPETGVSVQIALPQDATAGRCLSDVVAVRVRTAVTIRTPDRVRHGRAFTVRGRTLPAKPGARVSLWAKTPHRAVRMATGTVAADGRYRFLLASSSAGALRLFVKVGAHTGNLAGRSEIRRIVVG